MEMRVGVDQFLNMVSLKLHLLQKNQNQEKIRRRLPPKEDNYGQFSKGGEAKTRGMGCAIKGGKFEGVF